MAERVTLQTIADALGISRTTVSNAYNRPDQLAPELRRKVLERTRAMKGWLGSLPENQAVPDRSIGYTKPPGATAWVPNTDTLPYRGTSAGGGYSTVEDLARFAEALLSHKLLSADSTKLLITGKWMSPAPDTRTASKTLATPTAMAGSATEAAHQA